MGPDESMASEASDVSSSSSSTKTARKKKIVRKIRKNPNRSIHPYGSDKVKRMVAGLTKNNRELAKRLENREVVIADQNKTLQYFHERINHVMSMNTKVQEAMIKMNHLAAGLNDVVCTLSEVRDFARKAIGIQDKEDEHTVTLTMKVPVTGLDDVPNSNPQYNVNSGNYGANKMQMSAIDEDITRVVSEESELSADVFDFDVPQLNIENIRNAHNEEARGYLTKKQVAMISSLLPRTSNNGSNRRKSGLVVAANKTPPHSEQNCSPVANGSQTPKTPVLLSNLPKTFKSNIPKPLTTKGKETVSQSSENKQTAADSSEVLTNGSLVHEKAADQQVNSKKLQRKRLSKKPDEQTQPSSVNRDPVCFANDGSDGVATKKAKLGNGMLRNSVTESEVVSQVNTRRRTFILLQNNADSVANAAKEKDRSDTTESISSTDPSALSPDDRRKTFVMSKEKKTSANQANGLKKSLSKRKTFCVPNKKKSVEISPSSNQRIEDPETPTIHLTEDQSSMSTFMETRNDQLSSKDNVQSENTASESRNFFGNTSEGGDDILAKDLHGNETHFVPELSVLQETMHTLSEAASTPSVQASVATQALDATVHNVEDMELTEVIRIPIFPIVSQLPDTWQNGTDKPDGATPMLLTTSLVLPDTDSQTPRSVADIQCNVEEHIPTDAGGKVSEQPVDVKEVDDNQIDDSNENITLNMTDSTIIVQTSWISPSTDPKAGSDEKELNLCSLAKELSPCRSSLAKELSPRRSSLAKELSPCRSSLAKELSPCRSSLAKELSPCRSSLAKGSSPCDNFLAEEIVTEKEVEKKKKLVKKLRAEKEVTKRKTSAKQESNKMKSTKKLHPKALEAKRKKASKPTKLGKGIESGEIKEQIASPKVRGTLIIMKNTPAAKKSASKKDFPPPALANDPCCSKSLTPEVFRSRIRKRNPYFKDFFSPFSSQDSSDTDSDFEIRMNGQRLTTLKGSSVSSRFKSVKKKNKTPSSSTAKKVLGNKGKLSVGKGKSHKSLNFKDKQQSKRQSPRKSGEVVDVYDIRNIEESGAVLTPCTKNSSGNSGTSKQTQASVNSPTIINIRAENVSHTDSLDDDNADISIIGEVKGSGRQRISKYKRRLPRDRSGGKCLSRRSLKRRSAKLDEQRQPTYVDMMESKETSDDSDEDFSASQSSKNRHNHKKFKSKKKLETAKTVSVHNSTKKGKIKQTANERAESGSSSLEKAERATSDSQQKQPILQLADALQPIKDSSNGDLVKSGFTVHVRSEDRSDILSFKDKANDDSIIKVTHSDSGQKQQSPSHEHKKNNAAKNLGRENKSNAAKDLDRESKGNTPKNSDRENKSSATKNFDRESKRNATKDLDEESRGNNPKNFDQEITDSIAKDLDKENKGAALQQNQDHSAQKLRPSSDTLNIFPAAAAARSRRSRQVSYKEPTLNAKLRRP